MLFMPGNTHGRVVEDRPDINVLDLIKRIHGLDRVPEDFVVNVRDSSTAAEFRARQIRAATIDNGPEFVAKFGDDVEDEVGLGRGIVAKSFAKLHELRLVFLKSGGNLGLNLGQSVADVVHKDLKIVERVNLLFNKPK